MQPRHARQDDGDQLDLADDVAAGCGVEDGCCIDAFPAVNPEGNILECLDGCALEYVQDKEGEGDARVD